MIYLKGSRPVFILLRMECQPSNQTDLKQWCRCDPRRRWRNVPEARGQISLWGARRPHLTAFAPPLRSGVFYSLLVHISSWLSFVPFGHFNPSFLVFWNNPAKNIIHQTCENCQFKPLSFYW
jgi:hypothetical protein